MRGIAALAILLLAAGSTAAAAIAWMRLKRTPAETPETRRTGLGSLRTPVGGHEIFARVSTRPAPPGRVPVVLVHGLVVSSRYMVPLARALAPDFPVYAPDLPGFGESSKPARPLDVPELARALLAWMRALGLLPAALVGNSFGCQIIAELAARHPEAVDRLVLQGPTMDAAARSLWVQIWRALRNGRREPAALGRLSRIDYAKAGLPRAVATMRAMIRDRIEDKLPRIGAPTLVVAGSRDPVTPPPWAEKVARLLPDGTLAVIEGGTHTLNYTEPERLAALIEAFLLPTGEPAPLAGRVPA
ncbi:alpha/beta fold hydrolase [Benzoatithermus flavus]|uniref:Alpha/beta hydrolase n=1 Tax=Benzoatithermus flavus TaxID=3108223 RepID=A0ABU8XK92_9PROT